MRVTRTRLWLGLVLAGVVLAMGLATGVALERSVRARETEALRESLEARGRLVRELLVDAPGTAGDPAVLQRALAKAAAAGGVRVSLFDASGSAIADSATGALESARPTPPEVAGALEGRVAADVRPGRTGSPQVLHLAMPAPGGVVRVAGDLAPVEEVVADLRRTLLVVQVLGALLAFGLGVALADRLLRPVHELRDVLSDLADGDLSRRMPWRSGDEFAEIGRVIDRMAEDLRDRIQDLTAEKEQLRAVLLAMVEGVLVVDRERRVVLANPRLRELFGVWGEVVGRPALEVIRRAEVERALADAAGGDQPVLIELDAGEDRDRHLEMHAVRFPASGDLLGAVAVFHDVTDLHRLERVRSEFVANVSHELKTPLTAIRGFAETLQAEGLTPEQRTQYLEVVLRHAGKLTDLIDDLLELSRIEGRHEPLQLSEVDVSALARLLVRDLTPRLEASGIRARLEVADGVVARTDRRALEQVLHNLLDNAVKYTDSGGKVDLRVAVAGDRVRIDVADTGIGIPEEDRARVFERFFRVAKARTRDLGGTGLGLAIVKHLVQAVGGDVFVESQEDKGTTVSVLLPAR